MIVKCNNCGKEIKRKLSNVKTRKMFFCSILCKGIFQKGKEPWNKNTCGLQKSHRKGISMEQEYGVVKAHLIKQQIRLKNTGKKHTIESIFKSTMTRKLNQSVVGKNNPMYTTGISYIEKKLKKEILNCENCGILFSTLPTKRYINIHHIDKNRKNNSRENVLLLCARCHMKKHQLNGDRRGRFSVRK